MLLLTLLRRAPAFPLSVASNGTVQVGGTGDVVLAPSVGGEDAPGV